MNDPDAVFARAQDRLAADAAAANVRPSQRDHEAADHLLRRFAERMRGTQKTKIELGAGPQRPARIKTGMFRSYTYMEELRDERPHVMGWAFVTGFGSESRYNSVTHGDPDSRSGTWTEYRFLAVDVTGQLYLVNGGKPTGKGLIDAAAVVGFEEYMGSVRQRQWNGVGREVLAWCGYYGPRHPSIFGASDYEYRAYERQSADYEEKATEIDQFLAPGLAAALSAAGR